MKEGGTGDGRWNTKDEDEQRREKDTLNNEIEHPQKPNKTPRQKQEPKQAKKRGKD